MVRPYFRLLDISVKVLLSLFPTVDTAVMMVSAISEAIKPYSIAVAPDSLLRNNFKERDIARAPFKMRRQVKADAFVGQALRPRPEWLTES
jgi:hypothetical protein